MTRGARIARLAVLALALAAPTVGRAQGLAAVSVDDVRARTDGRHRLLVSASDADGAPLPGLEAAFAVEIDGAPVADLRARPLRAVHPRVTLWVVVDGALLRGDALARVREGLLEAARGLEPSDRIEIVSVSDRTRRRGASAGDVAALAERLGSLAGEATPRLYDGLFEAARGAARSGGGAFGLVLAVTRGHETDSRRSLLDVLAMARNRARLSPVMIVLVGDRGHSPEQPRLERLAAHTAGAMTRVTSPSDLPAALGAIVPRGIGRWVLTFRAPGWERSQHRHAVSVEATIQDVRRRAATEYATVEALPVAWWATPRPWVLLAFAVAGGLGAFALLRRRVRCLLVHDGDDDDGIWYEVYALPLTLGAASSNDVILGDPRVSRHHAVIERRGRVVELVDLNSENGTFVNGERISRRVLADGDRLSLGTGVHIVYEARG